MRSLRLTLLLLGVYLVFIGGGSYYTLFLPVRIFHHVALTLLFAVWLVRRIRAGRGLPSTPLNPALYGLVLVWGLSALVSIDRRMAFENLWFLLCHVLFFLGLSDLIRQGRQRLLMDVQYVLAGLVVLMTGLELASWYFGLGIIPNTSVGWVDVISAGVPLPPQLPRVQLALGVSTLLAGLVAPLITPALAWAMTAARPYRRPLLALALLLTGVLILTVSRGGFLSLAASLSLFCVLQVMQSPRLSRQMRSLVLLGGGVLLAVLLIVVIPRISGLASRVAGDEGRLDLWTKALEITKDHPLLGVGPGIFGRAYRSYRETDYVQDKLAAAHNLYLNTLAETGVVGALAALSLVLAFARATWLNWQQAPRGRQIRIEAVLAALVGFGVHSLVDTFTITPIVLLALLLVAYCATIPRQGFEAIPAAPVYTGYVALLVMVGFGLWLLSLDAAQGWYQKSMDADGSAFESLALAQSLDPGLQLYPLQRAYLSGVLKPNDPETRALYQQAVEIEPTWDTGWINLAALALNAQDVTGALAALDRARQINSQTSAPLHWARVAEEAQAAPDDAIIESYIKYLGFHPVSAFSPFWQKTPLRQQAVLRYAAIQPLDQQYRILQVQAPAQAESLIPTTPTSAAEWWMVGQVALRRNDMSAALSSFNQAVALDRRNGDYYVAQAQARLTTDPVGAVHDLDLAVLFGTTFTSPNAVRARLAATDDEKIDWLIDAVPPRVLTQEFAAVMYNRPASFDVLLSMADLDPGHALLQPWYDLADLYLSRSQTDEAIHVYQVILATAPEEREAADALARLTAP